MIACNHGCHHFAEGHQGRGGIIIHEVAGCFAVMNFVPHVRISLCLKPWGHDGNHAYRRFGLVHFGRQVKGIEP